MDKGKRMYKKMVLLIISVMVLYGCIDVDDNCIRIADSICNEHGGVRKIRVLDDGKPITCKVECKDKTSVKYIAE